MADPGPPWTTLVDPPLASPPPMADLQRRARRVRLRRRGGRIAGGAAVVVVLVGVAVALPGHDQTVRTAAGRSEAASGAQPSVLLKEFDADGHHWQVVANGACMAVRNEGGTVGSQCWPDNPDPGYVQQEPVRLNVAHLGTTSLLYGMVSKDVRTVSVVEPEPVAVEVLGRDAGLPVNFFAVLLPEIGRNPVGIRVQGDGFDITAGYQEAGPPVVVTPGSTAPPPDTSPATVPRVTAVPATTVPVTEPPTSTTVPVPSVGALRVEVVPGATDLHKQPFQSATASGTSAVLVRFLGGACGDVIGRVDVAETADQVTITLWSGYEQPRSTGGCTAVGVFKEILVPLHAPLGDRKVVDGAA